MSWSPSGTARSTATRTIRSWSPPPGWRPCWATPPSRCTRTTSGTGHLVGRTVLLPIVNREIPVVADEHVDPKFGTGAVKVTPAHDPNDFEIGRRHGLPALTILDEGARDRRHRNTFRRHGPVRGAGRGQGGAARAGPDRRREDPVHPRGRALLAVRRRHRTAAVHPVVRQGGAAGQGRRRRGARRPHQDPPAGTGAQVLRLGRQHARLVHLPAVVVGAPDPGLVRHRTARSVASGRTRNRRARAGPRTRTCWTPGSPPGMWPFSTMGWPRADRHAEARSTRRRCWSPATTSCSSGWSG